METDNGGPYHPVHRPVPSLGPQATISHDGTTLLDHFAGLAMQTLIQPGKIDPARWTPPTDAHMKAVAHMAYSMGKFMVKEKRRREAGQTTASGEAGLTPRTLPASAQPGQT